MFGWYVCCGNRLCYSSCEFSHNGTVTTNSMDKQVSSLPNYVFFLSGCIPFMNIELDSNEDASPYHPIRGLLTIMDTVILLFFPLLLYRSNGLTKNLVKSVTISEFSPHLKLQLIIWVDRSIGTPLFSPALCQWVKIIEQPRIYPLTKCRTSCSNCVSIYRSYYGLVSKNLMRHVCYNRRRPLNMWWLTTSNYKYYDHANMEL